MKKLFFILTVIAFAAPFGSYGAVNIKKAAPVATKKADKIESATSLLPTVIGLYSSVKSLSAQQQQLTAECAPTSSEIQIVNDLVKEWAKIGTVSASEAVSGLGVRQCNGGYRTFMQDADKNESCYEVFEKDSKEMFEPIWVGFPKASYASICDENNKNCKNVSNIYSIFAKIPFDDADYTKSEVKKISQLKQKLQKCSPEKLNAAKRELYGGFLTQALGSIGQTTGAAGTSSVLEAVSSMGGSGSIQSMLPSLGQMALKTFDK